MKKLSIYSKIRIPIAILSGFLLLASLLIALMPLSYGSTTMYATQATLQLARSNGLAKNALILVDTGLKEEMRTQAKSDMQVSLPLFEQQQNILLKSRDTELQERLIEARPYYLALMAATKELLDIPDSSQVSIVINSSRSYNSIMNRYLLILQQRADSFNLWLAWLQCGCILALVACFVGYGYVDRRECRDVKGGASSTQPNS